MAEAVCADLELVVLGGDAAGGGNHDAGVVGEDCALSARVTFGVRTTWLGLVKLGFNDIPSRRDSFWVKTSTAGLMVVKSARSSFMNSIRPLLSG